MSGFIRDDGSVQMGYLDKTALRVVGTRPIRPDGVDKVTGRANFGADMNWPTTATRRERTLLRAAG
jgi:hypothetical protein